MSERRIPVSLARWFALIAIVFAGLMTHPRAADAGVYVPTSRDWLQYEASYGSGGSSFPEAVAASPGGGVFLTHSDYNAWGVPADLSNWVIGFSAAGVETTRIGSVDNSVLDEPRGIDVSGNGILAIADTLHHRLAVYDLVTGQPVFTYGSFGTALGHFDSPSGVAIAQDGSFFVTDSRNNRVQRISAVGEFLSAWSVPAAVGEGPDGIAIAPNGDVWVALESSNKVCRFTVDGTLVDVIQSWTPVDEWGNPLSTDGFYGPKGVAVDPWGTVYVVDTENLRIVRFDNNGDWLGTFLGEDGPNGQFLYPKDVDTDEFGNVYVADADGDAVLKFHLRMADPDTVPPVTTSNIADGWTPGPVTVELTSTDASLSVEAIYYSTDGTEPTNRYSSPFSVSSEGTTTVKYYGVDIAQNVEPVTTQLVRIDNTRPVTTCDVPDIVWADSVTITLAASDQLSGVSGIYAQVDNGQLLYYQGPITVLGQGQHFIDFYAFDNAGNWESRQRKYFYLDSPDTQPPTTEISGLSSSWVNTNQTISLSATDTISGVDRTYLSTDGAYPTLEYAGPETLSTEGTTTVKFYSVDRNGNVEPVQTQYARIDKTPPTGYANVQESYYVTATIDLIAQDAVSGVIDVTYSLDGQPEVFGASVITTAAGPHQLQWTATDRAGNRMPSKVHYFTVQPPDVTPPSTGHNLGNDWVSGPFNITLSPIDDSGVSATYYSLDGSHPTVPYTEPVSFNVEGEHPVKFYSVDQYGNTEEVKSAVLRIDNTPPVSASDAKASYFGTATVTLTAVDQLSAVQNIHWRLDNGGWIAGRSGDKVSTSLVGTHTIDFYARDTANNREATKTVTFQVQPPDTDPPVTTLYGADGWARGPRIITLEAVDASSTVAGIWYSLDGSEPAWPYLGALTISTEGITTIKYRAEDQWGNREDTKTGYIRIDNSAPVTSSDAQTSYVDVAQINLFPNDPLSGVAATYYSVDDGPYQLGTQVDVTGYSSHTVRFYSVDALGNTESVKSVSFSIRRHDKVYEQTDSNILYRGVWESANSGNSATSVDASGGAWLYAQASRIRIDAFTGPAAGIARLSVDGGPWIDIDLYSGGTSSKTVWDSGDITFDYHLVRFEHTGRKNPLATGTAINVDKATVEGNLFPVPDTAPPVTTSNLNQEWQKGPVSISLDAVDTTTGVQATYYSLDGSQPGLVYSGPIAISTQGTTTVKFHSVDKRGNTESVTTQHAKLDNTAPTTSHNIQAGYSSPATITLTPSDVHSGVAYTKYRLDGGAWVTGTALPVPVETGAHSLDFFSVDNLGQTESTKTVGFTVYTRVDQSDSRILYRGSGWGTAPHEQHFGGTVRTLSTDGSAYFNFTGSAFALVAPKGGDLGVASVSVDGGAPIDIDLYSPTQQYRQRVHTVSGLSAGQHVLRVDWTGRKHSSSSSTKIAVDAIDVTGAVVADTAAPITLDDYNGEWRNTPVTVSLTATDTHSWVASTHYRTAEGEYTTYLAPFTVSSEGTTTLEYYSVDGAGVTEYPRTVPIKIDYTAPVTSHTAPSSWRKGPVEVTLAGTDPLSGLKEIRYTVADGPEQVYSAPISISQEGSVIVRYWGVDNVGNTETPKSVTVLVDDTAPVSSDDAPIDWVNSPLDVSLFANDGLSGVSAIRYSLNGGAEEDYGSPVRVAGDAIHTLEYASVDGAGNRETTRTATIRLDTTPPVTSSNAVSSYVGTATVTLSATDTLSGVSKTEYRIDGGEWTAGASVSIEAVGRHLLEWKSLDAAGNAEETRSATFTVADRYEQTDSRMYFRGSWSTGTNSSHSGGSWKFASTSGATAYIIFDGTGVDLIGAKGPAYGQAIVRVDGGAPMVLDYYNPTYIFNRTLLSLRDLEDTEHILTVDWSPVKNELSTGHYIGLDAVDIIGAIDQDVTPPSTAHTAPGGWTNTDAAVSLAATDTQTWVAQTRYRINNGIQYTYTTPLTISSEGTNTVTYFSTDGAGNVETLRSATVRVDKTAPVSSNNVPQEWSRNPFEASLVATDGHSGVESIAYRINDGPLIAYTGPIGFAQEGVFTLEHAATDHAGNVEQSRYATVRIDQTAPTTTDNVPAEFDGTPVSVTLTATDNLSEVSLTTYRLNGGEWMTYTGPFTIDHPGETVLEYRSSDNAGNVEDTRSVTVLLDGEPPVTASDVPTGWSKMAVTVSLSATDAISDIENIYYRIDDAETLVYDSPISFVEDGTYALSYWAVDTAGNAETPKTDTIRIDTVAPATNASVPADWATGAVTVELDATDAGSGIASTFFRIGNGEFKAYTEPFLITEEGVHEVECYSVDAAGNVEAVSSSTVSVDLTAPTTSDDALDFYVGTASITLIASDTVSGVGSTTWSLNGSEPSDDPSITVSSPGVHTLEYRSVDLAGNLEDTRSVSFSVGTRFEQSAPEIGYSSGWKVSNNSFMSGGSYLWNDAAGGQATIRFEGRRLRLVTATNSTFGIASVSLNGGEPVDVDLYSPKITYQQVVFDSGLLESGVHTLTVAWTGRKNPSSTGTVIGIDALDAAGQLQTVVMEEPLTRHEQNDTRITYGGTWNTSNNSFMSGGSYAFSSTATGTANIKFVGTRFALLTTTNSTFGIASVSIDGGAPVDVDLYSSSIGYQQKVFEVGSLAETTHTVRISWTGRKNPASTGTAVGVDAILLAGSLAQADPAEVVTEYEQTDRHFVYEGTWSNSNNTNMSGGSYRFSSTPSSTVTISFTGKRFDWITARSSNFGQAWVSLNGGTPQLVDLYAPSIVYKQRVWSSGDLPEGRHTVVITCAGTKNGSSTGTFIGIDRADMVGRILPVRYEQTHAMLAYDGTWGTSNNTAMSGGSYTFASAQGSMNVRFQGTSIAWVTAKSSNFGIARVYLNDVLVDSVDLYAPSIQYQQTVWQSNVLTDGAHTLRIEWTGLKNAASSGTFVGVDALDCAGYPIPRRFEQTDVLVSQVGTWTTSTNTFMSGGNYMFASSPATMNVAFKGTRFNWITTKNSTMGIAQISIDGGPAVDVDLYSSSLAYQALAWSSGTLSNGTHTATITWTGRKNPSSSGTNVGVDAFDVVGSLALRRYEQTSPGITYSPGWSNSNNTLMSGGSYLFASSDGASATITFHGKQFNWITLKSSSMGIAEISVDGGPWQLVDLYSPTTLYQQVAFSSGPLANGPHTVVIRRTGTKNPSASNFYVGIDAVDLSGVLTTQ